MDAPGIRISNIKPKNFGRFATNRGWVYAVERDEGRQEGDERGPQERSCGGAARSLNTALLECIYTVGLASGRLVQEGSVLQSS